ncbi:MAG: hypothetical protein K2M10_01135 [Muribaculaceae bacterium]|nr:hypothetical protein [Muribaculaceae bacterium]MDE6298239.1 hypothetical protein [Muribaculaceae bacterium]
MGERLKKISQRWREMRSSSSFHNVMVFMVFVGISALFWFILALNDSVQNSFNVRLHISNVPDSVTFISDIPEKIHISVRDKGTNLWRNGVLRQPTLHINFREYADMGVLKVSKNDLLSSLKGLFGANAQITSTSADSLVLVYTDNKGKRVPVEVLAQVFPSLGSTLEGEIRVVPSNVLVYGEKSTLDSIHKVVTETISLRDVSESTTREVRLRQLRGARIIPDKVQVHIPIEPLVKKEAMISLTPVNVPDGESLLLFPSKVPVEYYVAMSRLEDNDDPSIELEVDFMQTRASHNGKLKVEVKRYPDRLLNLSLKTDSVEYTIVKN